MHSVAYSPGYVEKLKTELAQCRAELDALRRQTGQSQPEVSQPGVALALLNNLIIDETETGILLHKASGECVRANKAAARLTGVPYKQMLRHNFRENRSWRISGKLAAAEKALVSGETQKFDAQMCTIYGKDIWTVSYLSRILMQGESYLLTVFTDVEDYKKSEDALREGRERYELAMRGAIDGIWDWNVLTNEDYFSERGCEMLGYSKDELHHTYATWKSLLHPEDRAAVLERVRRHLELREPYATELRMRTKSGEYRWFLACGQAIWDERGQATRMAGSLTDITWRKQAEQKLHEVAHKLREKQLELELQNKELRTVQAALEESRDCYLDLYEFAPVGYLTLSATAQIEEVNLTCAKLFGVEREKLLQRRFDALVTAEDRERMQAHFFNALQQDGKHSCELTLMRADGAVFHARLDCLHRNIGTASVLRIALTDISERKQAEAYLRIAATAFESQESMVITDANSVILQVNQAFTESTGYTAEEAVGQKMNLLRSGRHDADFYEVMWQSIHRNGRWQGEIWDRRKNGEIYPKWLTITAVKGDDGAITHYVGIQTDITQRKQVERALRESREAVRNLSARAEARREEERKHIAREVHDELGQVLTVLRMNIALLKSTTGRDDVEMGGIVSGMLKLVDRAIRGVRNVAGRLRPVALDMGIVAALQWQCQEFTEHSGIRCTLSVADDSVELEESRAVVAFRIVQSSLTNVARHAEASCVEVSVAPRDAMLEVAIRDDGKGFDADLPVDKKSFGILGMRERAIALGGELSIASKPGQGTLVILRIPGHSMD